MSEPESPPEDADECVVPTHPVPPEELHRYSPERDVLAEQDIAGYVEWQASDEAVQHVEQVKREVVLGQVYDIWDVTTDRDRWWVITNPTNLYSQRHFPSLDYTLSFHVGLMMRVASRSQGPDAGNPSPFDDVHRRMEQATRRHELATEAEDYQSVGMQLRECLITLAGALRRRVEMEAGGERPKDADFVAWSDLITDELCPGSSNKEVRRYLKTTSKQTWQLVNWLTHDRNATPSASMIALSACHQVVAHANAIVEGRHRDTTDRCPWCSSRQLRTHFDVSLGTDGEYFLSCAACEWSSYPDGARGRRGE
jgi:hypothetical protein